MLLTDFHYKLIAELEHKYGNLNKVPEDNVKLKIIRERINRVPKKKVKIKKARSGFSRYDYRFCYEIYLSRKKDKSISELSDEFDLIRSFIGNVMWLYGVRPTTRYSAELLKENEEVSAYNLDDLVKELKKHKGFEKFTKDYASQLMSSGKVYKNKAKFFRETIYPDFTLEDFKRKSFENNFKKSKTKQVDRIIRALNKINGEGEYTLEEVNRWNNR
ncbi:hypothetical protein [Apilactobacillus sp. EABW-1NA]|uniref:hypothetical protein n=1 Tax=Apilactobacillus sp. EABW-1NA TaxID=2984137 RepID=UPI0025B280BA|nr:hypothetical protein [Apilactobacillus sp. EABW-1NA]MDN2612992.1 hypothetical protein [Apilactobacillus sp. EABW-1NA]